MIRVSVTGKARLAGVMGWPVSHSRSPRLHGHWLERYGIVTRAPYQENPRRHEYRLTRRGADLLPVLQAMAVWGLRHIPDRYPPPPGYLVAAPEAFYPDDPAADT